MIDDSIDGLIRQRIFLVQQRSQEDAVRSIVVHLGYLDDCRGRVQQWNRVLGQNAGNDGGLAQCARPTLKHKYKFHQDIIPHALRQAAQGIHDGMVLRTKHKCLVFSETMHRFAKSVGLTD